jgi:5'-nucleotidase
MPLALILPFTLLLVAAGPVTSANASGGNVITVSVVSTNDLHGYITTLPLLGGYLANLRAARKADGGGVLLLDAGDIFQGTLESNPVEGASVIRAYNALGYQAAAVGNHDFDFGPEGTGAPAPGADLRGALFARAKQAHFPLLTANVVEEATGKPLTAPNLRPSTIVDVAGVRIGVVGVTTIDTPRATRPRYFAALTVRPLAAAIVEQARALRAAGATVVVAVAHAGASCKRFDDPDDLGSCAGNREIFDVARELPAGLVDAIVAGHTHAFVAHRVAGIPIIEAGDHGRAIGRVDLVVDRSTGHVTTHHLHVPRYLCDKPEAGSPCVPPPYEGVPVAVDARVAAAIAPDLARADRTGSALLGVAATAPIKRAENESALGDLFADLMRAARPDADLALAHSAGLRADLPAGPLRYRDLFEVEPSDNTLALVRLTGGQLAAILAENLRHPFAGALLVSGVKADARCEGNALVVTLTRADGRAVRAAAPLRIVTNSFLATGGAHILPAEAAQRIEADPPARDAVADGLRRRRGKIDPRALFDPAAPRVSYKGPLPVQCPGGV